MGGLKFESPQPTFFYSIKPRLKIETFSTDYMIKGGWEPGKSVSPFSHNYVVSVPKTRAKGRWEPRLKVVSHVVSPFQTLSRSLHICIYIMYMNLEKSKQL